MRYCNDCGACFRGQTRPTEAACECGNGCRVHCNCEANVARQAWEANEHEAAQRVAWERQNAEHDAAYARLRSGVVRIARLRAVE